MPIRKKPVKKEINNETKFKIYEKGEYKIPKIIHQLWIGNKPMPSKLMDTWKEKHPDYEYIRWTEEEFIKRNITFECQNRIDEIGEINGKADIMRWELIYKYGGIFLDADSICVEKLDDYLLRYDSFAGYENENKKPGLLATGTMGFSPKHSLPKDAIEHIKNNHVSKLKTWKSAWQTVGPLLLTNLYKKNSYKDMMILPSHLFLPKHHTGFEYNGNDKIYAYQKWGSTKNNYDDMNNFCLENKYKKPELEISILIPSYNTKKEYIIECLNSIRNQEGRYYKEIVWINDGSNIENTKILEKLLYDFEKRNSFTKVIYSKNDENKGMGYSLNKGVKLCSNDIIFRMDSDDIMTNDRIKKQLEIMKNEKIKISGGQIEIFKGDKIISKTKLSSINWCEYKNKKSHWIANHPTLCFRKQSVLEVGNYNIEHNRMLEDIDLELRLLKKYDNLINSKDILVRYRDHPEQVTKNSNNNYNRLRQELINNYIKD